MIQAIFHLSLYAEIEIVSRGNGNTGPVGNLYAIANSNIIAAADSDGSNAYCSIGRGNGCCGSSNRT